MSETFNIYCDESCHLENDVSPVMLLGAIMCPTSEAGRIGAAIQNLKRRHRAAGELKWNKVAPSRSDFYLELIDFFFAEPTLRFRALIVKDKAKLNHAYFNAGSHDTFYYKMFYYLLDPLIEGASARFCGYYEKAKRRATQAGYLFPLGQPARAREDATEE
jgi:hypothetical protein